MAHARNTTEFTPIVTVATRATFDSFVTVVAGPAPQAVLDDALQNFTGVTSGVPAHRLERKHQWVRIKVKYDASSPDTPCVLGRTRAREKDCRI